MNYSPTARFAASSAVRITDEFWNGMLEKLRTVTLPDVLSKFEKNGMFDNFRDMASSSNAKPKGQPYYDALVYEVIRAACDLLGDRYDAELDRTLDGYIELILSCQESDGYIGTYTTRVMPNCRFGMNGGVSYWQHDLYNAGAFIDAGIHHYNATGKKNLLAAAVRNANYLCSVMGEPPKLNIVPDHSLAEEVMIKLHDLFAKDPGLASELGALPDEYIALARFWIGNRGVHAGRVSYPRSLMQYAQDSVPLRYEDEAVGHAVRAVLLYSGAAALALHDSDKELSDACERLWANVTQTKMHITGGVGVLRGEECFSFQYNLPNNAYLETCASVGLAFWAANMCLLSGDAGRMDIFERALYNNTLAALSESGDRYFYENPLTSDGSIERWEWHRCPCCPPMMLKLFSALKTYIYSYCPDGIKVNLYIDSVLTDNGLKIVQRDGKFKVSLDADAGHGISAFYFRIPGGTENFSLTLNGKPYPAFPENGYVRVPLERGAVYEIQVSYDTPLRRMEAHPYIRPTDRELGVMGKVAVMRGQTVYCTEGIDNGGEVEFTLAEEPCLEYNTDKTVSGLRSDGKRFTLIPYYRWNNRGKSPMRVWLFQEGKKNNRSTDGWDNLLYREYKPEDK